MITLLLGPMFSGKTTLLLDYERRFRIANRNVLIIKYSHDNRYSQTTVVSHNGIHSKSSLVNADHLLHISPDLFANVNAILIDEGQFFPDLRAFCEMHVTTTIVVSGLSGDYQQRPFAPINDIIPFADSIVFCNSICTKCGENAPFTVRLSNEAQQTIIGGSELYEPRCRAHLYAQSA